MLYKTMMKDGDINVNQDNFDFHVRGGPVGCPYFHYKLESAKAGGFGEGKSLG